MKKLLGFLCAVTLVFGMAGSASALTISYQYGDQDGMGIAGLTAGSSFDWLAVNADDASDVGTITDAWMYADQTWTQTYDFTGLGTITSADLEIGTGGQEGSVELTELYLNAVFVGTLTDGTTAGVNSYQIDTFDLLSLGISFEGVSVYTLTTVHQYSGDGWALDYSLLTLSDDNAPVPEPSTILLVGTGLLGIIGFGRKRFNKKA